MSVAGVLIFRIFFLLLAGMESDEFHEMTHNHTAPHALINSLTLVCPTQFIQKVVDGSIFS